MHETVALISLGCAKNLVNSEQMLWLLNQAEFETVDDADGADIAIVNTCGFIDSAKSEAIGIILELAELKTAGRLQKIVVTGCLSERYREEILKEMPEVDAVAGVGNYEDIVEIVREVLDGHTVAVFDDNTAPVEETPRVITTGPAWAYLKIAEGCDNRCSYCAIPDIRGRFRSRPMDAVLKEAHTLAELGIKELIVVAQDITRYGTDLFGAPCLDKLLTALCRIDGIQWIRLHYLYPDEITDDLIDVIASEEKVLPYLDIPIQHINDKILRAMNRRGTGAEIRALFQKLRQKIPGLVLRTSLITGLPGEGEAEFEELCDFLREARIERAGVFPYSPEEGTPAALMSNRPDEEVAQRRTELIMELQAEIMDDYNDNRVGETLLVLCEGYDENAACRYGRTYADSPDIDGKVFFDGKAQYGDFVNVLITGVMDGDLIGEIV